MKELYNTLRHYGKIIADKNHETPEGHFIRITVYLFENRYYLATMFNGEVENIKELVF